jgi:SAM-dependent methyltransferase
MKKIEGWNWSEKEKIYIQDGFKIGDLDNDIGTNCHGDVISKNSYSVEKIRFYNTFEEAQYFRFLVCLSWMKDHFSFLLEEEGEKRKKLVIDLGCSRSFIYRMWRNNMNFFNWPQISYWGMDSNIKRINDGRSSFIPKKNDSVIYFLGDLSNETKFPSKADVIVCLEVLEHLPKKKAHTLLNNAKKNLKSSGIIIMSSPNPPEKGGFVWKDSSKSHFYEYIFDEAKELFIENGLKIIDHTGVLPDRNYNKSCSNPSLRKRLSELVPNSIVNNFLLLAEEDMSKKRQWICKLRK